MKYAITKDKKIHQVVNEKEFYENNPEAQDITHLSNAHEQFETQEENKTILDLSERANDSLLIGAQILYDNGSFENTEELMHFFEKPHKWRLELEELGVETK